MYFTIHGKNIEFMLLQCVEHKERESEIYGNLQNMMAVEER